MAIGNQSNNSSQVFECVQCKQQFLNERERNVHQERTCHNVKERFQCLRCMKLFGNKHVLQLHLRVHDSEKEQLSSASALCESTELENNMALLENNKQATDNSSQSTVKQPTSSLPAKKSIGLTKIRLEDCLRCDACSCIYIDKNDYNKHMKNFHRQNSPKKHSKQRKGCRSCCKHCNCQGDHTHQAVQKERGNNNLFHYNIKDRWTKMVSLRLSKVKKEIKADPDSDSVDAIDFSHLLSQVEVKIKTEPPEEES